MEYAELYADDLLVTDKVETADSFLKRFLGLMFRKSMGKNHALLITPCNAVHTFSMKFAIDVVYLDADGVILKIDEAMKPRKIGKTVKGGRSVLELNAYAARRLGLHTGNKLFIVKK